LQELNAGTAPRGLPRLIAISGLQASGKTTLARKIASNLGYYYVSQSPLGKAYLSDLKANPRRWAYETQLTFLCYKALEISDALGRFRRIIVDRSIYEDVNVFARSFFDSGDIDERSFETYKALAHHFTEDIPPPDLVIYCDVPVTTALARIKERGREDEFLHSRKHLEAIQALYTEWLKLYKESSVWKIDSTNNDWRDENIARDICAELVDIWGQSTPTTAQLTLFDTTLAPPNLESKSRRPTRFTLLHERPRPAADAPMLSVASVTPQYPTAYIAAPFTAKAKATQKKKRELLSA
jgi:deoxyadenosine/deoxycytidine kinase